MSDDYTENADQLADIPDENDPFGGDTGEPENPFGDAPTPIPATPAAPAKAPPKVDGQNNSAGDPLEPGDPLEETFKRLAALTPTEYELCRRAEAKRLCYRYKNLDFEV
ncbi:MAG: hypothetical protein FWD67_09865, partial [Betaproteobacteria bacterium]|nr:hypothetical protein [Betaproteobacteria bacterium]